MSRKSGQFLHPQDVVCTQSQGGTQSKKYYSSVYLTPDKSVMDDLDTSSSSLFGSEDMEHAFRDYCSQFSPVKLYQSFEEEVNKIKNSQDPTKTKQKPYSDNAINEHLSDATIDSGWGNSEALSNSLSNSESQISSQSSQENIKQHRNKKIKNKNKLAKKQKSPKTPLREQNMDVESDDIQNIFSQLTLENEVNQTRISPQKIESKKSGSQLPNKRKMATPRKLIDYNELICLKHKKTQTFNGETGVSKSKNANNSNENLENGMVCAYYYSSEHRLPTASPLPRGILKEAQMIWLRNKRNVGLWAMCDRCKKWRFLKDTTDPLDLSDKWYCYMNPDTTRNHCSVPEEKISLEQEKELIRNKYHAGSIVFAKIKGLPWWPAMVQDDPKYLTYFITSARSDVPKFYHVSFFCCKKQATGWIHVSKLKCFRRFSKDEKVNHLKQQEKDLYELQIRDAKMEAWKALKLTTIQRLFKYAI